MKKFLLTALVATFATSAMAMPIDSGRIDETINFPDVNKSYLHQSPNAMQADLLKLTQSDNKDSVRLVLGNPHFKEFTNNTWNYWLGVQDIATNKFVDCQLQVHFGDKETAKTSETPTNYYWNNEHCAKLMTKKMKPQIIKQIVEKEVVKEVQVPVEVVKEVLKPTVIALDSNLLFKFGSSELSPVAVNEVMNKIQAVKANLDKVKSIEVIGHTDRIGDELKNEQLGFERAKKVGNLLASQLQLPMGVITAESKGEYEPISQCSDNLPKQKLVDCLAVDRRVELKITFQ